MCGITGVVSRERDAEFATLTERMTAAVSHRGPDSHGVQDLGSCVLGNTRLAIVDLSERGHMPMCNEDSTVWITYNGECYNAAELAPVSHRSWASVSLHNGHGSCRSPLRRIWRQLRREVAGHVRLRNLGCERAANFSLRAIAWASSRFTTTIDEHGRLLFASEIKGLLASRVVPRKIDPSGIRAFLQLGHVPPPWTAIQGVKPLEPGYLGVWQDGSFETNPYWKLPVSTNGRHPDRSAQIASNLREILLESSRRAIDVRCPGRALPERWYRLGGSRGVNEAGRRRRGDCSDDRFRRRGI